MLSEHGIDEETAKAATSTYSGNSDPRLWAQKKHGWTRMAGNSLQTVGIDSHKMKDIANGILDAHPERDDIDNHKFDLEVVHPEHTGNAGQDFQSRLYSDVPFSVLDSKDINELRKYDSYYQEKAKGETDYPSIIREFHGKGDYGPEQHEWQRRLNFSNLPPGMGDLRLSDEEFYPREDGLGLDEEVELFPKTIGRLSPLTDTDKSRLSRPYSGMRRAKPTTFEGKTIDKLLPGMDQQDLELDEEEPGYSVYDLGNVLYEFRRKWCQEARNEGMPPEDITKFLKGMKISHAKMIEECNRALISPVEYRREQLRKKDLPEDMIEQIEDTGDMGADLMFSDLPPGMSLFSDRPAEQTPREKKPAHALDAIDPHKYLGLADNTDIPQVSADALEATALAKQTGSRADHAAAYTAHDLARNQAPHLAELHETMMAQHDKKLGVKPNHLYRMSPSPETLDTYPEITNVDRVRTVRPMNRILDSGEPDRGWLVRTGINEGVVNPEELVEDIRTKGLPTEIQAKILYEIAAGRNRWRDFQKVHPTNEMGSLISGMLGKHDMVRRKLHPADKPVPAGWTICGEPLPLFSGNPSIPYSGKKVVPITRPRAAHGWIERRGTVGKGCTYHLTPAGRKVMGLGELPEIS